MKKYIFSALIALASLAGFIFYANQASTQKLGVVGTKFVGTLPTTLSGSGISSSDASIGVSSLTLSQSGYPLTISDFGSTAYLTIEPGNRSRQEFVSCTGITQNSNGTAVLTTCSRGLAPIYPYTASTTFAFVHGGGSTVIVSNTPPFYDTFANKGNDATITGVYTFNSWALPRVSSTTTDAQVSAATNTLATVSYVNNTAFAGVSNGDVAVKGIVQLATAAQASSTTALAGGSTGASLVPATNLFSGTCGASLGVFSQSTGKILQCWLDLAASWVFTGGITSTASSTFTSTMVISGFGGLSIGATATNTGNLIVSNNASTTNLVVSRDFNGWASSTSYSIVTNTNVGPTTLGGTANTQVSCPAGKVVIGGGASNTGGSSNVVVRDSYPSSQSQWYVTYMATAVGAANTMTTYAICVKI